MTTTEMRELPSFTPGSIDWQQQRCAAVGGSEIAAILGLSPWDSRFSLWFRKQQLIEPQPDNPGMEWGRRLEHVIACKYADEHPDTPVLRGGTWTRADRPWQIAAPDRVLGDREALLEIKTDHFGDGWGEPGTDQIPVYYRAQCLWYLDTFSVDRCDVAVLIGGSDYREYVVRYAADEAKFLRDAAREFLDSIANGERPRIDEHQATYQTIRELHPDIEPEDVELPADLVREFCAARVALKQAKANEQRTAAEVADRMGNARRGTFLGDTIATRQARGNGTPYLVASRNLPNFDPKAA